MKTQHVFFDLDRTLWDFEKNSKTALELLYDQHKLKDYLPSFTVFHETYKAINREWWNKYRFNQVTKEELRIGRFSDVLEHFQVDPKSLAAILADRYVEVSPFQTNLFPNTIETLQELKANGHALHIITNGFKEVQFIKLRNSKIITFFDDILCSEDVGVNKPDPRVFQRALSRTKAKPAESIMIGDDFEADVIGAEKCGIKGVLFDPEAQFKSNTHIRKISSLKEVPEIVLGF